MDDNVHPDLTMRVVDRLIAANKDFELLIVPGAEHIFLGYQAYVTRRGGGLPRASPHGQREPPAYRLADIPLNPDIARRAVRLSATPQTRNHRKPNPHRHGLLGAEKMPLVTEVTSPDHEPAQAQRRVGL